MSWQTAFMGDERLLLALELSRLLEAPSWGAARPLSVAVRICRGTTAPPDTSPRGRLSEGGGTMESRILALSREGLPEGMLRARNVCGAALQTRARRLSIESVSAALLRGEVTSVQARTRH